jgi:hypothetical protein
VVKKKKLKKINVFLEECGSNSGIATWIVAVAGWQWYQSKEEIGAVRMMFNRAWQWQYWPRYGDGYKRWMKIECFFFS